MNYKGWDTLTFISNIDQIEILKYFIEERNEDINKKNKNRLNVLLWASHKGYLDIVKYLTEERNADID